MSENDSIKRLLPPCILPLLRWWRGASFKGNYPDWESAASATKGYEDVDSLARIISNSRKVRDGEYVYERDGTLFNKIEYSWPLLSSLMAAAANNKGSLKVLDFGGALGSTYRQNMPFFSGLEKVSWAVVETPRLVSAGKKEFQTKELQFFENIKMAYEAQDYNVVLLASVLPYISEPYAVLEQIIEYLPDFFILDRTMVVPGSDRLTVQVNSSAIGKSSYPAWFLSEKKLLSVFKEKYHLISDFIALGDRVLLRSPLASADFKGYIFRRKL